MASKIHKLSDVQSNNIGLNTNIWQYSVILEGAVIGSDCNICSHVFIEGEVVIGNGVTIKNGTMIYNGVTIDDGCFIGPSVSFTNDIYPRSKRLINREGNLTKTKVAKGVSIGANSTIKSGINIGEFAMIGAGSVVTKNIPPFSLVIGNPAKIVGKVDEAGNVIEKYS